MKKFHPFSFLIFFLFLVLSSIARADETSLTDIANSPYKTAILYLTEKGIVQGYPDHSYQPTRSLNRAEFTKLTVGAVLGMQPEKPTKDCFPDVSRSQWYASWICYAKTNSIIAGYKDGHFKPDEKINLAEAAKILVNTLKVKMSSSEGNVWYEVFINSLQDAAYLPDSFSSVSQLVNRGQMAEMLYRIMEKISDRTTTRFHFTASLACLDDQVPANVDMKAVRNAWLNWHNQARADHGTEPLILSTGLNYSSSVWAKANKKSGEISHDRPNGQLVTDWFTQLGIKFKPLSGVMYGENLGFRTYRCSASDCTDEAVKTAHAIFDAFMAEEGTSYTGHYENVVERDFTELGLGIAIDSSKEAMYLTTQYSFGVESYPPDLCKIL